MFEARHEGPASEHAPEHASVPLLGHLPALRRDPLGLLSEGMRRQGEVARFRFGPYRFALLSNPEHVRHVLVEQVRRYPKSPDYESLRLILGDGLVTSEGELWRRQRRMAQPAFQVRALAGFLPDMTRATEDLLARWAALPEGAPLDVHEEMMALTLRIVGWTLFGIDLQGDAEGVGRAFTEVISYVNQRTTMLAPAPLWLPTPANRRFLRARDLLDRVVYRIIEERRRADAPPKDLLGLYMAATDEEGGERMSDRPLRDEVMTLVGAGHETTAVALSWTFMLLSRHPEAARRVREEARAVLRDGPPTAEALERLRYTGQVLQESMRLYPPVWIIGRKATEDDRLGAHEIRRGTLVGVSPYTLHRSPALWDNPEGFDPERFSEERSRERARYAYLPFGAGPRVCIGGAFALMEAKLILALVARRFRLELRPGYRPDPEPSVTLRPRRGVPATLHRA